MAKARHLGAFITAIGWWWVGALLEALAIAQEVGKRVAEKWDGVVPMGWLVLAGSVALFVGTYRAYAKVADEQDALRAAAQTPPLSLVVTPEVAGVVGNVPYDLIPNIKMSVLYFEASIANSGPENVNLDFLVRAEIPGSPIFVNRPSIDIPFKPRKIPKSFFKDTPWIGEPPLHVPSKGPATRGWFAFALDNPMHEWVMNSQDVVAALVCLNHANGEEHTAPLKIVYRAGEDD